MKTLLRIDSSVRKNGSYSRGVADYFQSQWQLKHPDSRIIFRDLTDEFIPHINQRITEAFYDEENNKDILDLSDRLIKELMECNTLLITSPIYNFSLSSALKAYFDHVIRLNKTFRYSEDGGFAGLLQNKRAVVIASKGGVYKGTALQSYDFLEPYLKAILNFIGINDIQFFSVEGTSNPSYLENSLLSARSEIEIFWKNEKI